MGAVARARSSTGPLAVHNCGGARTTDRSAPTAEPSCPNRTRLAERPDRADRPVRTESAGRSGLSEDPVHLRAAHGARALSHPPARLADLDLTVEVALLLALHAVSVVALGHAVLHSGRRGRAPAGPQPIGARQSCGQRSAATVCCRSSARPAASARGPRCDRAADREPPAVRGRYAREARAQCRDQAVRRSWAARWSGPGCRPVRKRRPPLWVLTPRSPSVPGPVRLPLANGTGAPRGSVVPGRYEPALDAVNALPHSLCKTLWRGWGPAGVSLWKDRVGPWGHPGQTVARASADLRGRRRPPVDARNPVGGRGGESTRRRRCPAPRGDAPTLS